MLYCLKEMPFAAEKRREKALSLIELQRFRQASESMPEVEPVQQERSEADDCISIKADYKVSLVKYADIIYMESMGEYVRLHLTNGTKLMTLFRLKIWRVRCRPIALCVCIGLIS